MSEKGRESGKPRLLIATDNFQPRHDGIARFLAEIIPRLQEEYEIVVVSPDYGVSPLDLTIRRVLIPTKKREWGDYNPAEWRPRILKEAVDEADLVFSQTIGPVGLLAHWYAWKAEKPVAAFIHSIEWELVPKALNSPFSKRLAYPLTKFLTRRVYNRASLLIVPSKNIADLLTWQEITTRKVVVHLGVETRRFVKGSKEAARARLKLPKDAFIVGFHGRIGYEKNLLTLSRAFLRLREKKKRLLIIGEGVPALKERLARVRDTILPGAQEKVVPWLQAMDVYVMPSFTETTSLAVLEAMSCELPVVSSPVGFIRQYIREGKNGFFFETKNPYDLARKLQRLAQDPALRARIGRAARKTVRERFDWDKTAEGIAAALRSLQKSRTMKKR